MTGKEAFDLLSSHGYPVKTWATRVTSTGFTCDPGRLPDRWDAFLMLATMQGWRVQRASGGRTLVKTNV